MRLCLVALLAWTVVRCRSANFFRLVQKFSTCSACSGPSPIETKLADEKCLLATADRPTGKYILVVMAGEVRALRLFAVEFFVFP